MKRIHFLKVKLSYWFNWSRLNTIEVGVNDVISDDSYFINKEIIETIGKLCE